MSETGRQPTSFVVGIGASAGGLEGVELLAEILAKKTTMAVSLAIAGEAVKPDHV